ncbi:MAG: hypothetical protein MI754_06455, partial [Chromatiales bacterium]|nr:hypothetical protein [Chromatiales bacterium]
MKKQLALLLALGLMLPLFNAHAVHNLESPQTGSIKSGIGVVRGWLCDADEVAIRFDDMEMTTILYGNVRRDTESICDDRNNGFELLVNWSNLGPGQHRMRLYADGEEIDSST